MNKVELIEVFLVCIIISIQLWVFVQTYIKIGIFRSIIPQIELLKISKILIPRSELERLSPKEILSNLQQYKGSPLAQPKSYSMMDNWASDGSELIPENNLEESKIEMAEVNIVECDSKTNYVFDNILFAVNNYLIRNRGAASDFNLIKDVVERNTNAVEEDINLSIGVPLYLGLMGTMIGIVIGLFNMPDLSDVLNANLNEGISLLIGGVKIAMIASFTGLLLTIFNSGWTFKSSRGLIEARKNDLYTFIQIELLPIINQGLASTLESLQRNLLNFNNKFTVQLTAFSSTVSSLSGIFDSSKEAIKAQKELLDTIDKTKVSEMTRYNVKVLQQLDISVLQFEKFNSYMTNVNVFVENSGQIVSRTNELLERTDNFKTIAINIDSRLNQSQQLLEFLSDHFNKLEEHKEFTKNTVVDVGFAITSTFKDLQEHILKSSEAVKQFTIEELDALKTALLESKTNLSNLEHLASINKDVSQFKNSSASQGERVNLKLDELNKNITTSVSILEGLERTTILHKAKGIITFFKKHLSTKN